MDPRNAPPATARTRGFGRRQLLAGVPGLALLPMLPLGRLAAAAPRPGRAAEDLPDWVRIAREQVPAATTSPYFQTGGIGPSPTPVIEQVADRLDFQNRSPAAVDVAAVMSRIEPDLRARLARVFGAGEDEVALTHSTSEGISIVAWSLDWRPGDEVVISNTEHPANVIPWYVLRDRFGIVIREIDLSPGTDLVGEVRNQLSDRTRMVSLSHVSRNNGRTLRTEDSARLAELLRARGVRYHLDGAQGPGCVDTDFAALGCDCYSTCGHKWLLGPKGTGALFVRRALLDEVKLSWAGAHSHETMDYAGNYTLLPSAARYEFGTRALADFHGFGQAVQWMEDIGFERILDRINKLVDHGIEAIRRTPGLSVASPEDPADRSAPGRWPISTASGRPSSGWRTSASNASSTGSTNSWITASRRSGGRPGSRSLPRSTRRIVRGSWWSGCRKAATRRRSTGTSAGRTASWHPRSAASAISASPFTSSTPARRFPPHSTRSPPGAPDSAPGQERRPVAV